MNDASHFTQFSLEHPRNQHYLSNPSSLLISLSISISLLLFYFLLPPRFDVLVIMLWVPSLSPFCWMSPACHHPPPPLAISTNICAPRTARTVLLLLSSGCGTFIKTFCPCLSPLSFHGVILSFVTDGKQHNYLSQKRIPYKKAAFTQQRMALLDCPKQ